MIVGDRAEDLRSALEFLADHDLVLTSGGLGPTADDLTADVVAEWAGAEMVHDPALEERIWSVVSRLRKRMPFEEEAMRAGARKQAFVPVGAAVLEPVGTAPGLLVGTKPIVAVLPGSSAGAADDVEGGGRDVAAARVARFRRVPGAADPALLPAARAADRGLAARARRRRAAAGDHDLPAARGARGGDRVRSRGGIRAYAGLEAELRERHGDVLFSDDGSTIDEIIARLLTGRTIATAESCTGGLMAGRLTDLAGSSAYVLGGLVVYSNEAKTALAGVPAALIEAHGAVSPEVATALSAGARSRLEADIGIGITGIAGPGGGSPEKPVGTVCISVSTATDAEDRVVRLPGDRATSATAPPPSRSTCCGRCCCGHDRRTSTSSCSTRSS